MTTYNRRAIMLKAHEIRREYQRIGSLSYRAAMRIGLKKAWMRAQVEAAAMAREQMDDRDRAICDLRSRLMQIETQDRLLHQDFRCMQEFNDEIQRLAA